MCIRDSSHTCAYGALGAFGTGVGCTDYLYAMVTGKSWLLVPETIRFNLTGKLREGVYARDLILTIIGKIGAAGASYMAMEFVGDGMKNLTMDDRISMCNLCVEAGAKTALMEVDDIALDYLHARGREPKHLSLIHIWFRATCSGSFRFHYHSGCYPEG